MILAQVANAIIIGTAHFAPHDVTKCIPAYGVLQHLVEELLHLGSVGPLKDDLSNSVSLGMIIMAQFLNEISQKVDGSDGTKRGHGLGEVSDTEESHILQVPHFNLENECLGLLLVLHLDGVAKPVTHKARLEIGELHGRLLEEFSIPIMYTHLYCKQFNIPL